MAHHRCVDRHRRSAHRGHRGLRRSVRSRTHLLPDGLRRRMVPDAEHREVARPLRRRRREPARPGLPTGRGRRAAVARSTGRPRASTIWAGPTASTNARWTAGSAFLDRIKGRELPGFDEAAAWLRAHKPIDYIPGIMHGDYQFANVMFRARCAGPVGRHRRLGDGHHRRPEARPGLGHAVLARGHQQRRRQCRRLCRHAGNALALRGARALRRGLGPSGRRHRLLLVLARWKLAVMLEQGYQRAKGDPKLEAFGPVILDLMRGAAELATSSDYQR